MNGVINQRQYTDLLIFPGGGSPNAKLYKKVYDLLIREAKNRRYDAVSVLSWPGHCNKQGRVDSELTMESALRDATKRILEQERLRRKYHILGRSFGTIVAVACTKNRLFSQTSG